MREHEIQAFEDGPSSEIPVRDYLHISASSSGDGLVLTHGAGSDCRAPLLGVLATSFCESGMTVLRCDLPFRQSRPQGPPPRGSTEREQQGLRRAVEVMKKRVPGRVFLGGHSYGGRQASILAASESRLVDALLLLSYPLHPPKRLTELRTAHFPSLRTTALFVHGIRDGFGSIAEMTATLKLIPAATQLLAIEGAGHELMTASNRADLPRMVTEAFAEVTGRPADSSPNVPSR